MRQADSRRRNNAAFAAFAADRFYQKAGTVDGATDVRRDGAAWREGRWVNMHRCYVRHLHET